MPSVLGEGSARMSMSWMCTLLQYSGCRFQKGLCRSWMGPTLRPSTNCSSTSLGLPAAAAHARARPCQLQACPRPHVVLCEYHRWYRRHQRISLSDQIGARGSKSKTALCWLLNSLLKKKRLTAIGSCSAASTCAARSRWSVRGARLSIDILWNDSQNHLPAPSITPPPVMLTFVARKAPTKGPSLQEVP